MRWMGGTLTVTIAQRSVRIGRGPGVGAALHHLAPACNRQTRDAASRFDPCQLHSQSESPRARPHSDGTFDEPIRWKRSARIVLSSQPSVAMVFHSDRPVVAHKEVTRALGRLQPFVGAGAVHVAADVVHVELHHAGHVRAIDRGQNLPSSAPARRSLSPAEQLR